MGLPYLYRDLYLATQCDSEEIEAKVVNSAFQYQKEERKMIPKIKNILYATDLSKNSAYAFRYAVNTAQKHDANIHILHVIESLSSHAEALIQMHIEKETLLSQG